MKNCSTVFMLSGQGAQYYGMGTELYTRNPSFRKHLDALDNITVDTAGASVLKEIFNPNKKLADSLHHTLISSLAIYLIERALTLSLAEQGVEPDYILGSSLGMVASIVLAGCLNDEEGIKLVHKQCTLLEENCIRGIMIAILDNISIYHNSPVLKNYSQIAAINFENHFAISLPEINIPEILTYLDNKNVVYQKIPVSLPYHSKWIDSAEQAFLTALQSFDFKKPRIPIVSCSKTVALTDIDANAMWAAVRSTLMFQDSIHHLETLGNHRYIDISPSGTMATFAKYALGNLRSEIYTILSPFPNETERFNKFTAIYNESKRAQIQPIKANH